MPSPGEVDRRLLIVVVETALDVVVSAEGSSEQYPVRLLVTYDAAPEAFDSHLSEFDTFLGEIELDGSRGVLRRAQVTAPPPAAPH